LKRLDFIRHLEKHGCVLLREGAAHSLYVNRSERKASTVPRHREINDFLCRKICKDLGVAMPGSEQGNSG
jgi:mRNA interferase HicA